MYERFTERARKVMQLANQEAQRFHHEYIGTEHILLGLIQEGTGSAANVLKNLDINPRKIRVEVGKLIQAGPDLVNTGKLPQTSQAKKVIEYAVEEARNFDHSDVDSVHLLLGLLREPDGVAGQVLRGLGLKLADVREEMLALLVPDGTTPKPERRAAQDFNLPPPLGAPIPSCPAPARLLRLLNATLPEDEQAPLMEHLEGCAGCREALEALAAGRDSWAGVARGLRDEPGPERTAAFPPSGGASLGFLDPPEKPGQLGKLAHYEVLEVVGRGGMGVVLKAFDQTLHRVVAVKVMAPELAVSGTARERFEREAQAAAAVSHDHVVTIHAVSEARGLPYLVMQYVQGESLQQKLDREGPLPLKEVLRIGLQAAQGLAAAHAQGLIHRDIKPANVLLENGVQRVKITDFGLARAVDDASLTQSGVIAGTPMYMSPEQSLGEPQDYRTDLFSLGSVLYTLCTGHPPFRAGNTQAVLRRVAEDTPRPIRETHPEVPDWLEAIVEKLMEKHPADRFQSAAEVAGLLESHLAHLQQPAGIPRPPAPAPVARRPVAPAAKKSRVLLWVLLAAGALCLAFCLLPVMLVVSYFGMSAHSDRSPAIATEAAVPPVLPVPPVPEVPPVPPVLPGPRARAPLAPKAIFNSRKGGLLCAAISKDEKTVAAGFEDGSIIVWDVATGKPAVLTGHKFPVRALAFLPHGKMLLSGAGELPKPKAAGEVKLWDLATGKMATSYNVEPMGPVWTVAVSPDGTTVAAGGEGGTCRWEVRTGRQAWATGNCTGVRSLAFAPNGQIVAATCDRPAVAYLFPSSWQEKAASEGHEDMVGPVCFYPDSRRAATGSRDGRVKLWDVQDYGRPPKASVRVSEKSAVRSLGYWRRGGGVLAVGLSDQTVKLIDASNPGQPTDFPGPGEEAGGMLAASLEGTCLVTAHSNGVIKLWDVGAGKLAVPSAREEAARQDAERLQGAWERVAIVHGANRYGPDPNDVLTFRGKQFEVKEKGKLTLAGTFEIVDATSQPKQMDLVCTEGRHKGKRLRAVYRLDGNRLETCTDSGDDDRPKMLSGARGFYRDLRRKNP
jgi:serine/threonine-protein kinase